MWSEKVAFKLCPKGVKNIWLKGDRGCLLDRETPGAQALTELAVFRGTKSTSVAGADWAIGRV